jgi:hypothetical protein
MSDIAIRVESLSKAYRIDLKEQQHETGWKMEDGRWKLEDGSWKLGTALPTPNPQLLTPNPTSQSPREFTNWKLSLNVVCLKPT